MSVEVTRTGPVFDGTAEAEAGRFVTELEQEVAELGVDLVRTQLDRVLRNPSGYYRSKVTYTGNRIHDSRVIYGPWLEGIDRRNRTTRFKGYSTFRLVSQKLDAEVGHLVEIVLPPHLEKMK